MKNEEKLTILYICPDVTLGGSTRSLIDLIDAVKEEVKPIILLPDYGLAYDWFGQHNIECIVHQYVLLYKLPSTISLANFISHPWRLPFLKYLRQEWSCIWFVLRHLRNRKIDIVHSNSSVVDIGIKLARLLRAKHVWHVREFCDLDFHLDIYGGLLRLRNLINYADARIAISTAIKEHWKMSVNNTWVINDAIRTKSDVCYFQNKDKFLLFSSYNLTEEKGARIAIETFARSGVAKSGFQLKMMGNCDESYYTSLMETIREYNIEDAVEFVHCQTDVKPYFSRATAYIMASECEGLGRVTAEAMFYGCPVIAHATGGTLDLVKDGETGYLYNTIEDCAQLIRKVCAENQEKIILRAQEFAVNNLSQEVYGPKIMEVYRKVLS